MTDELGILSAVVYDRTAFEAVREHVEPEALSAHGQVIWKEVARWYDKDPAATQVDPDALRARLIRAHPKHEQIWAEWVRELRPEVGSLNIAREVLEVKRKSVGDTLALALTTGAEPGALEKMIEDYQAVNSAASLLDAGGATVFSTPLDDLITATENQEERVRLLPAALNRHLRGGLLPGHCVVVFGRVNVGKSAFAINATAGFLRQGLKVLYVENEDLMEDTALRVGCRLLGCDRDWAAQNPRRFKEVAIERGYDRFILPDPAPTTVADVDRLLLQFAPDVCVVNQARNMVPDGDRNPVMAMDQIAKGLRNLGKKRRIIMLLVTAAREMSTDWKGEPRESHILEMHECYSSRTGFPAAADLMIGFGASTSLAERQMACLNIAKNKLSGSKGQIYVSVDFSRGLIKEANE